jgi:hypothetical protein
VLRRAHPQHSFQAIVQITDRNARHRVLSGEITEINIINDITWVNAEVIA